MRRLIVASLVVVFAAGILGIPAAAQSREVPLTLGFSFDGRAAWLYVGMYRGYFSEEGIRLNVFRGFGGDAAALAVDQGRFTFGAILDISTVTVLRTKGSDLRGIMLLNARSPHGVQAFADKGIRRPKDLEGHSIGLAPGTIGAVLFPIFARLNDVDLSKVRVEPMAPDLYVPAFMSGRIDVINGFYDALYQVVKVSAARQGKQLTELWFKDWGLDAYGTMVVAKEKTLRENPDLVRRFLRASKRAWDATKADPARAIRIMRVYHEALDPEISLAQLKAELEISEEPGTAAGCASMTKVQKTVDTYREAFGITTSIPAGEVFTNEFMAWCRR